MGTWIKETDQAVYLMDGGHYIDAVLKQPSSTNPKEQVANIEALKTWFQRDDKPRRMTVSVGIDAPEPQPLADASSVPVIPPLVVEPPEPETPVSPPSLPVVPERPGGDKVIPSSHGGMQIRTLIDTFFKLSLKDSSQLTDKEKVLVESGTVFDIEYYTEVGRNHWLVELLTPTLGDRQTTSWYVFAPSIELLTGTTLTVVSDTLFKQEPKLSIDLPPAAKQFVKNGSQYKLLSFTPAAGNHTKVELADATLGDKSTAVWYAFAPDIKIQGQRQTLQVVSDTLFKRRPVQSVELSDADKVFVRNKTVFLVSSYAQPADLHVRVSLQGAFLGSQSRNTWYCFVPDVAISGTEIGNRPEDEPPSKTIPESSDRGIPLEFPGFQGTYYANDPIYRETQYGERGNFTWAEALHVDAATGFYRRPANAGVVYNILEVASVLEDIRRRYNQPMQINSWYRDPATNAAIGGASQSRHLTGDAVDFVIPGIHPYDVYADLDPWWGSRGGLASSTVFTHIDMRGYRARWDYGY